MIRVLVAVLFLLVACSGAPPLPSGAELMAQSAEAMRAVRTAQIAIEVDPAVTVVPLRSANGALTAAGEAQGSAVLALAGGPPLEYQLVVAGDVLYVKGPTGEFTQLPLATAASLFDPTAILDPDRGVAVLLASAEEPTTQAREEVDGVDSYRVDATFGREPAAALVPGLAGPVPGTVWLDAATSRVVRAELRIPDGVSGTGGPVTVRLYDYDAPVTVTPPS